ncbi:MAG: chemotaxis protein CheW [Myxococcaceae bacterium]
MRYVLFRIEKDRYALPLGAVREVLVSPESLSRVPRAPPGVRGVMNLRGRVVTVLELGALLGLPLLNRGLEKLVLLDRGRRDLGLLVSEVEGIEDIEKISPAPGAHAASVQGIARIGARAVTVLSPEGVDAALSTLFQ